MPDRRSMCAIRRRRSLHQLTIPGWTLQTGEWVLALEGVCRVAVSGAAAIGKQQQHYEVEVEVLRPRCPFRLEQVGSYIVPWTGFRTNPVFL